MSKTFRFVIHGPPHTNQPAHHPMTPTSLYPDGAAAIDPLEQLVRRLGESGFQRRRGSTGTAA